MCEFVSVAVDLDVAHDLFVREALLFKESERR